MMVCPLQELTMQEKALKYFLSLSYFSGLIIL